MQGGNVGSGHSLSLMGYLANSESVVIDFKWKIEG
jgi:hypothetical protein